LMSLCDQGLGKSLRFCCGLADDDGVTLTQIVAQLELV